MAPEIVRKLIGGAWRTVEADPGGGPGSRSDVSDGGTTNVIVAPDLIEFPDSVVDEPSPGVARVTRGGSLTDAVILDPATSDRNVITPSADATALTITSEAAGQASTVMVLKQDDATPYLLDIYNLTADDTTPGWQIYVSDNNALVIQGNTLGTSAPDADGLVTLGNYWGSYCANGVSYEWFQSVAAAPADAAFGISPVRMQWYDGTSGKPVARFKERDAGGTITSGVSLGSTGNQDTVGSAGGAAALPATPSHYIKVRDVNGDLWVIPAYAAA